jgi:putative transcriptional regulator
MQKEETMSKASEKTRSAKKEVPFDVKAIRAHLGMSQAEFARRFNFSTGTLRHWERGDRVPRGPSRVLLGVIAKNPQAVLESLA